MVGGLAGYNGPASQDDSTLPGVLHNCYSAGPVIGRDDTGGLVGTNDSNGIVTGCFWDIQTSGIAGSAAGAGLPTTGMQTASTFIRAGWDFSPKADSKDYWTILPEPHYPSFAWQIPEPNGTATEPDTPAAPLP